MLSRLKEAAHLVPVVLVFVAALVAFLVIRHLMVPQGFGKYGHYRAGALDDIRKRPVSFAGQTTCAMCHDEVVSARAQGKHRIVSCEACHGPQAKHADDPSTAKPPKVAATGLCKRCHEEDKAKPGGFPQVATADHSGGAECVSCHQPHAPHL